MMQRLRALAGGGCFRATPFSAFSTAKAPQEGERLVLVDLNPLVWRAFWGGRRLVKAGADIGAVVRTVLALHRAP